MERKENQNYGISVYEKGGKNWVRVKTHGHDFLLGMEDIEVDGMDEFNWKEACEAAESIGYTLPNKEQWELVDVYKEEVNRVIEENGGKELIGIYWSVARYDSGNAWFYHAYGGRLYYFSLYGGFTARPLAYPDDIES